MCFYTEDDNLVLETRIYYTKCIVAGEFLFLIMYYKKKQGSSIAYLYLYKGIW